MSPALTHRLPFILAVLLMAAAVTSASQQASGGSFRNGSILGRAVTLHAGSPIADAVVVLRNGSQEFDAVRTTAEGWFLFTDVPPGDWTIGAVKAGYQGTGNQRRAAVTLELGEHRRDVEVALIQFGAIEGTVIDEVGEPVVGVTVQSNVLSSAGFGGWTRSYSATTDDRGRYRLFLAPNTYTLSVPAQITWMPTATYAAATAGDDKVRMAFARVPGANVLLESLEPGTASTVSQGRLLEVTTGPQPAGQRAGTGCALYPTRFNGGSRTASGAPDVVVTDGAEVTGVDLVLEAARGVLVSGRMSGLEHLPVSVPVRLATTDGVDETTVATTYSTPDGGFTFPCVAAGEYVLQVEQKLPASADPRRATTTIRSSVESTRLSSSGPARAPDDELIYATLPMTVGDEDVHGLTVELRTGRRLSGRMIIDDEAPATARLRRSVQLWAVGGREAYYSADVGDDLTFTTPQLPAGEFYLTANSSDGLGVRSILVNGDDVADGLLMMPEQDVRDVVITMASLPTLSGHVEGNRDLTTPRVMVFPTDRALWPSHLRPNRRRALSTNALPDGSYVFNRVPPGEYFIAAVEDPPPGDWRLAESLEALARQALRISVEDGQAVTKDLDVLPFVQERPRRVAPAASAQRPTSDARSIGMNGSGPFVPEAAGAYWRQTSGPSSGSSITGRIVTSGQVVEPVRAATVAINSVDGAVARTVVSAGDGRFEATGLPPGRYIVEASKPAYLTMANAAPSAGRPGMPIEVLSGQSAEVTIALARGAVITGRVTNALGQPFMGARVEVLSLRSTPDGPSLVAVAAAEPDDPLVDDTGRYRVYGLPAGDYYVGVAVDQGAAWPARTLSEGDVARAVAGTSTALIARGPVGMYAPAFHPFGSDISTARVVHVEAGDVADSIDIRVDPEPAGSVEGRVVYPDSSPAAGLRLVVLPSGLRVPGASQLGANSQSSVASYGGLARLTTGPDGSFAVRGLPARHYTVAALSEGVHGDSNFWAVESLAVNGEQLRNIVVTMQPGLTIAGRITIPEAVTERPTGQVPTPSLALRGTIAGALSAEQTAAEVRGDGTFSFTNVVPGRYLLEVGGLSGAWIADAGTIGGVDILDVPADIAAESTIELTLTPGAAEVSGRFEDTSGVPASQYYLVLFSANRAYWHEASRRIAAVRPSADGRYRFPRLSAGDYLLAAVTDLRAGEWHEPTRLERLAIGALPVTVPAGAALVQDIRIGSR